MSGVRRSAIEVVAIVACPRPARMGQRRSTERACTGSAVPSDTQTKVIENTVPLELSTGNTVSSSPAVANGFLSSRSGFRLQAPSHADYGTSNTKLLAARYE